MRFPLLLQDHAQVIYTGDSSFRMMDAGQWLGFSEEETPQGGEDFVRMASAYSSAEGLAAAKL